MLYTLLAKSGRIRDGYHLLREALVAQDQRSQAFASQEIEAAIRGELLMISVLDEFVFPHLLSKRSLSEPEPNLSSQNPESSSFCQMINATSEVPNLTNLSKTEAEFYEACFFRPI